MTTTFTVTNLKSAKHAPATALIMRGNGQWQRSCFITGIVGSS